MDKKLPARYERAFKDADIRGISGPELDDDLAYAIAQAFVKEVKAKAVVVGYDMRISTPSLVEAFRSGVQDAGVNIVDIGLCSSPMLYFASGDLQLPGVMITASHSPANYNGLKLVRPEAVPLTKKTGLSAILQSVKAGYTKNTKVRGRWQKKDVRKAYIKYALKGMRKSIAADISLAADAGNGMASLVLPLLEQELPTSFSSLFTDMDGRFPNRGSDPTIRKHQRHLVKLMKEQTFDFGIAFDGDADRIAFLDEKGKYVNCAIIGALIAEHLLKKEPKGRYVFTNLTSRVYEESIAEYGGKPVRARVGHAFLKEKMRQKESIFGCEHSGHFFFRDFYYTDSVVLTLRYVLEIFAEAKKQGQTFSELVKPYRRYHQLEDEVVEVEDKREALQDMKMFIEKVYPEAKFTKFDGWYIELDTVWGAVKPSVTEHAIKIMFEGKNLKETKAVQAKLSKHLHAYAKRSR